MIRARICVAAVLLTQVMTPEETVDDRIYPADIADWTKNADKIVIGTFQSGFSFPWFDGWHHLSRLDVRESVLPAEATKTVQLPWVTPYGTSCFVCDEWQPFDGKTGIWFLRQRDHRLRLFGGTKRWCSAPLDLAFSNAVREAAQRRIQSMP
jgi:hypothetical protein